VISDVAIIGGGIIGSATAAFLAAAGAGVALYEQAEIAAAASGRNSGVVQHPFDDVLAALYGRSLALYRDLARELPDAFALDERPAGLLYVGPAAAEDAAAEIAGAWARAYPEVDAAVVLGRSLTDLDPALAPDVAACRLEIGYPVMPASATRAYASLARRLGADIVTGVTATLAVEGGIVTGIDVDGRHVPAGVVVVAAGPWTPAVVGSAIQIPGWPPIGRSWGVVATVELEQPPRHVLEEIDIDIEPDDDAGDAAANADPGYGFSLVTAASSSALGSTFLPEPPEPSTVVDRLRDRGARYVPGIAAAPVVATRTCARPVTPDGRPLIGPIPGIAGAFIAAGHGPWGISTGPGSARLVADLVLGATDAVAPALDPARFGQPG
jgi:D-hydroxyproline dehydrogenase subunit beta